MRSSIGRNRLPSHTHRWGPVHFCLYVFVCVCVCLRSVSVRYLQQASAPRDVWLSKLLSVSEVMVGSLLGSVGSVDMDETSLAEDEEEVGCGGLSITAAPVLKEVAGLLSLHFLSTPPIHSLLYK